MSKTIRKLGSHWLAWFTTKKQQKFLAFEESESRSWIKKRTKKEQKRNNLLMKNVELL
jgi:hypothetical protein